MKLLAPTGDAKLVKASGQKSASCRVVPGDPISTGFFYALVGFTIGRWGP